MARPLKNNADYFSHDAGMRNDPRVKAVRRKYGLEGYAIYNMFIECLTNSENFRLLVDDEIIAGDFELEPGKLREIMIYCVKIDLFQFDVGNQILSCKTLENRFEGLLSKRKRDRSPVIASDNTQSKVKESKVKESKVEESKVEKTKEKESIVVVVADKSATIEERGKVFYEKLKPHLPEFGAVTLRKFFDYWTEHSEGGRKMRFEKEKVFDVKKRLTTWKNREKNNSHDRKSSKENIRRADAIVETGREFGGFE